MKTLWATVALIAITVILQIPTHANASKILFLLPFASKSHCNVFDPLINELLIRGHDLTVVSPIKSSRNFSNLVEIHPVSVEEISNSPAISGGNMFQKRKKGKLATLLSFDNSFIEEVCHKFYQNEDVVEIIKNKPNFDLIFVNAIPNQCVLGLVHHLNSPHVYLGTLPLPNAHVAGVGGYFPRSFIPSAFSPYTSEMTFTERLVNFIIEVVSGHLYYQTESAEIYRKYLGKDVPSVREIDRNLSLVFMNTNFLLTFPRPLLPNIIEIGGLHCKDVPLNTIPKDLSKLLDEAENGFIYFSLGSIARTKNMPPDIRRKFLNVFSRLKQLVVWKWDNENETDLPKNVIVRKWLPQQAILSHPNIKLFITHGGLLSTHETVYHGVPILGAPLYVDQDLNMKQAENLGMGLKFEITDFTEESLENNINMIISDPRFSQTAKKLSKIISDQPETPLERAVFWTEYVIRHGGAEHLRSSARDLNAFQYHSLDVISFLACMIIVILWIVKFITSKIIFRVIAVIFKGLSGKLSHQKIKVN